MTIWNQNASRHGIFYGYKLAIVLLAAAVLFLTSIGPAFGSGPAERQQSQVFSLADQQPVEGAVARLVRTDSGAAFNLRTSGLEKGHAVSIWWVIFNNPDACAGDPCQVFDLFNPAVNAAVQAGGGHVIGGSGEASFAGHLNEGQITNEHPAFIGGPGLVDARGAEIHLVVRSHGPVIPGLNHEMFTSFEVGCDVNDCEDLQFALFK